MTKFLLPIPLAALLFTGCSTTNQAKINSVASTVAKDAATLQSDLSKYGPQINALAVAVTGTSAKATKVQGQVSAVTTDASQYAADAQTLAQIIAALTASQPVVSGS